MNDPSSRCVATDGREAGQVVRDRLHGTIQDGSVMQNMAAASKARLIKVWV